jgi:hypothetical protein
MKWLTVKIASVTQTGVAAVAPTSNTVKAMIPAAKMIFRSRLLLVASLISRSTFLTKSTTARAEGVTGEELGLRLDAAGQFVELGVGAVHCAQPAIGSAVGGIMLLEVAVEFIVAIGVVVQDDTARGRVDGNLFDAGDDAEDFADLLQQFGIALAGRDLHAHPPRHLVLDPQIHLGHRPCSYNVTNRSATQPASRRFVWDHSQTLQNRR